MFDNLAKEIIYYSLVPVWVLELICFILIVKKKKDKDDYKFNYMIKVILMIIDGMVLSLLIGYSVWTISKMVSNGVVFPNIIYIIILVLLIVALAVLLFATCKKLYNSFENKETFD